MSAMADDRPGRSLRRLPELSMAALRLAWRAGRRELIVIVAVQAIGGLAIAGQVLAVQSVLAEVVRADDAGEVDIGAIVPGLVVLVALTAVMSITSVLQNTQTVVLAELVARYADDQILDVTCAVELEAFERPAFHDRLERAKINAATQPLAAVRALAGGVNAVFGVLGSTVALIAIQPLLLPFVVVALVPLWLSSTRNSRTLYQFRRTMTPYDRRRNYFFSVLTNESLAKDVRAFQLAPYLRARREEYVRERIVTLRTMTRSRQWRSLVSAVVAAAVTGAAVAALVWLLVEDRMTLAEVGAAMWGLLYLGQRSRALVTQVAVLYESSLFIEDFTGFREILEGTPRPSETLSRPGLVHLRAEDLSFTYPDGTRPAVDGVTLDLRSGEIVALVGENGSGKTTLAKLLGGLYRPTGGRALWDGVDMASLDPDELRQRVTVLFQDFARFQVSVRENVGMGRTADVDDLPAIMSAAEQAGAAADIERLAHGYETELSRLWEGGTNLSGGQWQRIALARALFRDAPLLILDEPTASLDPRAESQLFDRIRGLCDDRAVLLISHRFATVRLADRIYVLSDGRVVEEGPHEHLIGLDGLYAKLFMLQASAFGLDPAR